MTVAEGLPIFSFSDLKTIAPDPKYLKIMLSRRVKSGDIIRLKKGLYTSSAYWNNTRLARTNNSFLEFVANKLATSSYLSLDYVLQAHGMMTEMSNNFTSIALSKPIKFANSFGVFIYHKIRPTLFTGFTIENRDGFDIYKACLAKALFDWLYLRRHLITDAVSAEELRLNWDAFASADWRGLKHYCVLESSRKMRSLFDLLYTKYGKH